MDLSTFFPEARLFLAELAANNAREWFTSQRDRYERVIRQPCELFCERASHGLEKLVGHPMEPRVYRIHRDLRFSQDRTPYNTHLHIGFFRFATAGKRACGGFFFGIETGRMMVGAGNFVFPEDVLARYRTRVDDSEEGEHLAALLRRLTEEGFRAKEIELKRVPRGYASDHPRADLLRRKSLAIFEDIYPTPAQQHQDPVQLFLGRAERLVVLYDWILGLENAGRE
ncbi:MAG: DUF2461 domain-containing protein [Magnetococcales bacterium]|nr:DUF2461 domain-containing protein [Magnetococcales bacterium]